MGKTAKKAAAPKAKKAAAPEAKATAKKAKEHITFNCVPIKQGDNIFYAFAAQASQLLQFATVNRRDPDTNEGYQRNFSPSRVSAISKFIIGKNPLPLSIFISIDSAKISEDGTKLTIEVKDNSAWIIDGQHRVLAAEEAESTIELPVVAAIGLEIDEQIHQFVTINREAKGVPSSLYIDLLKHLPTKKAADFSKERARDIADILRKDENSPFYGKIAIVESPKKGEISLVNFARKVSPLLSKPKGSLSLYSVEEQWKIVNNYFLAIHDVFGNEDDELQPFYLKTLPFGAFMNAFEVVFNYAKTYHKGFTVADAAKILSKIRHHKRENFDEYGTGSQAETLAGEDIVALLRAEYGREEGLTDSIRL